ncbi:hypothetical protein Pcinc_023574 [Petrolisthes cinctipes]|uniref:Uncharacterized protein n=1 Tax=Petrolisthes cinctipes TaxID=88211 RepID=A0AAE1FBT7_PETCI|nr:hypothetical protein Pcinc_023574 [Petrolisthes cinctipes]
MMKEEMNEEIEVNEKTEKEMKEKEMKEEEEEVVEDLCVAPSLREHDQHKYKDRKVGSPPWSCLGGGGIGKGIEF